MSNTGGDELRYEIKLSFSPLEIGEIEQVIKLHPMAFRKYYPDRWVNNIYFDTYDLFSYEENLCGQARRCKMRYRWYGESIEHDHGVVEFKHKDQNTTTKTRFDFDGVHFKAADSWDSFTDQLKTSSHQELSFHMAYGLRPVLINRYYRKYFESSDRLLRVTLDHKIQFYDQTKLRRPNFNFKQEIDEVGVMELKASVADKRLVERFAQSLDQKVSRFSKFVIGLQSSALI